MTLRKKIEFFCPGCKGNVTKIEEIIINAVMATSLEVFENGGLLYGASECVNGEVGGYQCYACGHILRNKNNDPITEEKDAVGWLKNHKKKGKRANAIRRDEEF